jgi:hypothetical protein
MFGGMTPEMWEAFAAMEGVPVLSDARQDCCVCGATIDTEEVYLEFIDMVASAHIPCIDRMLTKLEEKFYR